jgi:mannose-6-phosphate isomerase-like protein (cupin superfamily)
MTARKVVTGLDAQGRGTIVSDEPIGGGVEVPGVPPGWSYAMLGSTAPDEQLPESSDPPPMNMGMAPGSTHFAIWTLPPVAVGPNPAGMHRTDSVDYVVVLSGGVSMIMSDGSEVDLHAGDCVVQGGVRHEWENRTDAECVMAVIVVGVKGA